MDNQQQTPAPVVTEHGDRIQMAELYAALAAAQGEFEPIVKNRSVSIDIKNEQRQKIGSYTFRYADLEEITAKTRPALSKNGLATVQIINPSTLARGGGSGMSIYTRLLHKSGAELVSEVELPAGAKGGDIKTLGATISYLRRYAKSSLLDIAADDDLDENGEQAGEQGQQATQSKAQAQDDGEFYTDEQFQKNLPSWTAAIVKKGSPHERVIQMASSKRKLTEKQIETIRAIQAPTEDNQQ